MALMILCDQFPRNIYRKSEQAFQYDKIALQHAQVLATSYLSDDGSNNETTTSLTGKFYPPYLVFMGLPFIHSEDVNDHTLALKLIDISKPKIPKLLHGWWEMQRRGTVAHKDVLERFGRYPHRNKANNRTNTLEEEVWLADVDNLPTWAKSQL